jgi:anti-anti-sigma regulatory factor
MAEDDLSLNECAGHVEVQEVSAGIGSVCEEVAVLYANGNTREAEALLDTLLRDSTHADNEWPWAMLLDLYCLTGQRERFEARVIEFATRFERSPPPWKDLSAGAPKARGGATTAVNLSGNLGAGVSRQLAPYVVIGQRNGSVRIDLQTVRGADDAGCQEVLEAIAQMRRDRVKVSLINVTKLLDALSARVVVGTADQQPAWQLLLELLQHCGDQERFEQVALDYAITFEESPPSWDPVAATSAPAPKVETTGSAAAADVLCFEGEVLGGVSAVFGRLVVLSEKRSELEVDCSGLRRMDFVSAGTLFNVLSTLQGKGRNVTLSNVNPMVLALLHVMGVGQVARIIPRS